MVSTTMAYLDQLSLGLGTYFSPVNALSKQKREMHHTIHNMRELKLRRYATLMIILNGYLIVLPE